MSLDEILSSPGFPADKDAVDNLRVILECIEADFAKPELDEVTIMPVPEHKSIVVEFKTSCLLWMPEHNGKYLADLFRIPDAVGIRPDDDGMTVISFSSVVWY